MKAKIIEVSEQFAQTGEHLEAKLTVKRDDRLQTVRVRAWDLPSYDRYCKIITSVLRRMRR